MMCPTEYILSTTMAARLLLPTIYFITIILSCGNQDPVVPDLNGHWHITEKLDANDSYPYTQYQPIEIFNDTSIAISELFDDFLMDNGGINFDEKIIYLRTGHSYIPFTYTLVSKDSLSLDANGLYDSMSMVRIYHTEDNLSDDITRDSRIYITPIEVNLDSFIDSIPMSVMNLLEIGYNLDKEVVYKTNEYTVQKIYGLNDAMLELERHKIKLPESMRSDIAPLLIIDKNIPSDTLTKVATIFKKLHFDTVLVAYQNPTNIKSQKLAYIKSPIDRLLLLTQGAHSTAGEIVEELSKSASQ